MLPELIVCNRHCVYDKNKRGIIQRYALDDASFIVSLYFIILLSLGTSRNKIIAEAPLINTNSMKK